MNNRMNNFSAWATEHRALLISLIGVISLFFIWQASQLKINATPYFLEPSHPSRLADVQLKQTFSGSGEVLMIATITEQDSIFNSQSLSDIYQLTLGLESLTLTSDADIKNLQALATTTTSKNLVDRLIEDGFSPSDSNILQELQAELAKGGVSDKQAYLADLAVRLRPITKIRNLVRVESITSIDDELDIHPMMYHLPKNQQDIVSLRQEALDNPMLQNIIFSAQPNATNNFIELAIEQDDAPNMRRIYSAVNTLIESLALHDSYHLGGPPAIFSQTSAVMEEDSNKLFPGVFLVVMLLLYLLFRDLRSVFLPMLVAVLSVIWTLGSMALLGFQQNIVSTILPVFLISIGVADSIHYLSEYRRQRLTRDYKPAIQAALQHLWKPMLMTTATTAIGFLSLSYTKIVFIREFGFFVALGIVYAYALTITLLPAILASLKDTKKAQSTTSRLDVFIDKLANANAQLVLSKRKTLFLVAALIMLPIGFAISHLKIDNEMIGYFDEDSQIFQDNDIIKQHFAGAATVEFTLSAKQVDFFKSAQSIQTLEAIEQQLLSHKHVNATYGLPSFLKLINQAIGSQKEYRVPYENPELIPQYYFLYESSNGDDIRNVVDGRYQKARLIAFVDSDQTSIMDSIVSDLVNYVNTQTDGQLSITPSGFGEVLIATRDEVIYSQITSLGLSLLGILLLLCLLFKSLAIGLVGIVPLTFTVLINFALMSALGIYLDVGTAIVAPIAIGVGVDYAIYFLSAVKRQRQDGLDIDSAIQRALKELYRPIGFNTIVLGFGFMVLSLSSHESLIHLGMMISSTMFISALISLSLLPAITRGLQLFPQQEQQSTGVASNNI